MKCSKLKCARRSAAFALIFVASAVHAELRTINDDAMSDVWGQALFELTNSNLTITPTASSTLLSADGSSIGSWKVSGPPTDESGNVIAGTISFSKMTFGAEMELDAEIGKLRLGSYTKADNDNGGSDINANRIILTGYQRDGVYYPFKVKNPYLEFAMKNSADPASKEILGFRFGFEQVDGILAGNLAALSGRVLLTSKTVSSGGVDQQLWVNSYDARSAGDGYLVPVVAGAAVPPAAGTAPLVAGIYKDVEAICLGRTGEQGVCGAGSDQPTRDFWISVNKVNTLFYPRSASDVADYTPAQKGVWMNVTDNARIVQIRDTNTDASLAAFRNVVPAATKRW